MMEGKTVLLATARPVDAATLAGAAGPILGLATADAARHARVCGGILAEWVDRERARALVEALAAVGVGARVIDAAALPTLDRARRASRALAEEAALDLRLGALGPEALVGWEEVVLALPFAIPAAPRAGEHAPDLLNAPDLSEPTVRLLQALRKTPARIGLDIITRSRAYRLWRSELEIPEESGIPPGLAPHSLERFLALARTIVARAVRAPEPPECAALLESGLLEPALFSDLGEVIRYERWLLAPPGRAVDETSEDAHGRGDAGA
jgi:hypothetical protein